MEKRDERLDNWVMFIFLGTILIGLVIAFVGNLDSTTMVPKDKPKWMNVTANTTTIFFSYDATQIQGFKSILLRAGWADPEMNSDRELYSVESTDLQRNISFPKMVTVSTPPMFIGATVSTEQDGVQYGRQYVWKVYQSPFTLGFDDPIIDYMR